MPVLPGFLYMQGYGSIELLSGLGIDWSTDLDFEGDEA